jgi:hypothetical protein
MTTTFANPSATTPGPVSWLEAHTVEHIGHTVQQVPGVQP